MTLLITIYLIGCVVAYVAFKKFQIGKCKNYLWTVKERAITILWSFFSWITVFCVICVEIELLIKNTDWDKPAKW